MIESKIVKASDIEMVANQLGVQRRMGCGISVPILRAGSSDAGVGSLSFKRLCRALELRVASTQDSKVENGPMHLSRSCEGGHLAN